jgi:hypothetical protein
MEQIHGKYEQKSLSTIAANQTKVSVKMELKNLAKKILTTTANCFITGIEKKESEIRVLGKVITRAIFVDETDGFNSEEHTQEFSEKFAPKNMDAIRGVTPMATVIQSTAPKFTKAEGGELVSGISTEHTLGIALTGLLGKEVSYVKEVTGGVESISDKATVQSWGANYVEKFDIGETFTLDQNVEGILGVELTAHLRDISVTNERFTLKGTASVNALVVRTADGAQTVGNALYEFDFAKTFNKKDITDRDTIYGSVTVTNVGMKVENLAHPSLTVDGELMFMGNSVIKHEINTVKDAYSCGNHLEFSYDNIANTAAHPQQNMVADVEGNVSMPEGSPFISRVLLSSNPTVSGVNVKPAEDKTTVEGVLRALIIYECEEKQAHSHTVEVPFSINCKVDNCTNKHNINVALTPLSCNVKARRGKELLIDARIGVNLGASQSEQVKIVSTVKVGAAKPEQNHAITIHIAGGKETLWDIAKNASMPVSDIVRQNPQCEKGIAEGDRITLYRRSI